MELRCEFDRDAQGAEPVDWLGLTIFRTSDAGETEQFLPDLPEEDVRQAGFVWVDAQAARGRTYRYYVEYSADVYLCSNVMVVTVPERESAAGDLSGPGTASERPVFVEISGLPMAAAGIPHLAVAKPSEPGGVFTWEALTPRAMILRTRGHRALVEGTDDTSLPMMVRVTYTLRGKKASAYYCPALWGGRIPRRIGRDPRTMNDAERAAWWEDRARHVARMQSPEGVEDLRRAIRIAFGDSDDEAQRYAEKKNDVADAVKWAVVDVGRLAIPELRAFFDRSRDPDARIRLVGAMGCVAPDYVSTDLLASLVDGGDVPSTYYAMLYARNQAMKGALPEQTPPCWKGPCNRRTSS